VRHGFSSRLVVDLPQVATRAVAGSHGATATGGVVLLVLVDDIQVASLATESIAASSRSDPRARSIRCFAVGAGILGVDHRRQLKSGRSLEARPGIVAAGVMWPTPRRAPWIHQGRFSPRVERSGWVFGLVGGTGVTPRSSA
jgi:hypothetical protein